MATTKSPAGIGIARRGAAQEGAGVSQAPYWTPLGPGCPLCKVFSHFGPNFCALLRASPRGRWKQGKPSLPRLALRLKLRIGCTGLGAIVAAPRHWRCVDDLLVGKKRGPYVDRETALWRAAGADTFGPTISQPIFYGTRVPAVDVSQLHQSAPGSAQSLAAETGGPALLTAEIFIPALRKRYV